MKRFSYIAIIFLLLVFCVGTVSAIEMTVFGPEKYLRTKGKPNSYNNTFTSFEGEGKLVIINGDESGKHRISSAEIEINGSIVLGPSDFNQQVDRIEVPLTLKEDNSISVKLKSKPGSYLAVQLVQDTESPFSAPSDPDKIINDEGAVYPINEIIINLTDEASNEDAQEIASSIGGAIVGFVPSIKLLQVKVPASSKEELQVLADELSNNNNPLIEGVFFNYLPALLNEDYNNDLEHRKSVDETSIAAYEKIELFRAYDYLIDKNPPFNDVKIGIIDNGLYLDHVEFENVEINWGDDTPTPADGHGTAVTGIIGANNIAGKDETPADSQMNGILAGVPDPTSDNGSKIKYKIEFRQVSLSGDPEKALDTAHAMFSAIDEFAIKGVQVINMSLGMTKRSLLSMSSLEVILGGIIDHDFYEVSAAFYETAYNHYNIVFVAATGNAGIDASNHVPACVEADNFITVGATDLNDQRGVWPVPWYEFWKKSESNWGEVIDIAAPGEHIWAPVSKKDSGEYYSDYDEFGMTSGAAPLVTGVVGLMLAINKDLKPVEIRDILIDTGYDISEITDKPIGGVRLDAYEAVKKVLDDNQGGTITVDGDPSDWEGISPIITRPAGNYDDFYLINLYISHDDTYVYFLSEYDKSLSSRPDSYSFGMVTFDTDLDSYTGCRTYGMDENNTGKYIGVEYKVNFVPDTSDYLLTNEIFRHVYDYRECRLFTDRYFPELIMVKVNDRYCEVGIPIKSLETLTPNLQEFDYIFIDIDLFRSYVMRYSIK